MTSPNYLEYVFADHRDFELICDIPKDIAEAWIALIAEEAKLTSYMWDPSRISDQNSSLMNKGCVRVAFAGANRDEIWLNNHDNNYSLLRRKANG